jgi:RecQ family ATP-dependent DNA helicase
MRVFDKLAYRLLEHLLKVAEEGKRPDISAWLHKFLASGPELFQQSLRELVKKRGWDTCKPLLRLLIDTTIGAWIPVEMIPRFTFIDLEQDIKSKDILEFAIATVHPFTVEPEIDELKSDGRGPVRANDIKRLIGNHTSGDWIVGHNIREFDADVLAKVGVHLPAGALLDTLELSLILDPLNARHALDAEHNARGDVKANIALFWCFDERWLNLSNVELNKHSSWHDPASGLGRYLRNVTQRQQRKKSPHTPKAIGRTLRGLAEAMGKVLDESGRGLKFPTLSKTQKVVTLANAPGPIAAANYVTAHQDDLVAVPAFTLRSLRRHLREVTGSLRLDCTWSINDQLLDESRLQKRFGASLKGVGASYMWRWLEGGGRLLAEIHPGALPWVALDLEQDVESNPLPLQPLGLTDHATWLKCGGSAIVIGPENLEEAAGPASGPSLILHNIDDAGAQSLLTFIRSRTLRLGELHHERLSILVGEEDRRDPLFGDTISAFKNSSQPSQQMVGELINEPPENSVVTITCRVTGSDIETLVVEAPVPDRDRWLRLRLRDLQHTARYVCGPLNTGILGDRLNELLGVKLEHNSNVLLPGLRVAEDGSLGSLAGIGQSMMGAARRLIVDLMESPNTAPTALGFAPELQQVMVGVIRGSKLRAHAENLFGTRRRTIQRLGDNGGYILIGDSNPEPLPPHSSGVLIRRLPFPSKSDPDVQLALKSLPTDGDPFREVILPRLLRRLMSLISVLREQGMEPLLLDKRALVHTGYRREIETALGELHAIPAATGLNETQLEFLRTKIDDGLRSCGLRTGREAFADVDPDPVLRKIFGPAAEWRPHQRSIVARILKGEDLLSIMPTGGGKSACFQVPAIVFGELADELTVVISPLIALMRDQVSSMKNRGVWGVSAYNSDLDQKARLQVLQEVRTGWTSLLYLAPEQLLNPMVRDTLFERGVRLLVVDEAHCMSEWGHDFRPEYRKIGHFLDELALTRAEQRAQILALTATASKAIQKDIVEALSLASKPIDLGVRRPELSPYIRALPSNTKFDVRIDEILKFLKHPDRAGKPGIIYATTRDNTEKIAGCLKKTPPEGYSPASIDFLHARVSDRAERENSFLDDEGETSIIVSTTAFGMGIDKSDVKWVIHADAPGTIEAYAQEMGRAAREPGMEADTLALVSPEDLSQRRNMARSADEASVISVLHHLRDLTEKTGEARSIAMLKSIAFVSRVEENQISVCLFHLERVGILKVESRVGGVLFVKTGPKANEATGTRETKLLDYVAGSGRFAQLNPSDLAKDVFSEEDLSIEECGRLVRSMLSASLIERVGNVEIEGLSNEQKREETLRHWSDAEQCIADMVETRFVQADGRWVRFTPRDQLELVQSAKITSEQLHHIIAEWRAHGLLSVHQDIFNLSLIRGDKSDLVRTVAKSCGERSALLADLENAWKINDSNVCERSKASVTTVTSKYLSELATRGILRWDDISSTGQGYKFEWISKTRSEDKELLNHLKLNIRRSSVDYRIGKLEELFAQDRGPDDIWNFIETYFSSDERIVIDPRTAEILRDGLTKQQRTAIDAPGNKPLLINAGAGTGKTHVLARRVLRLQAEELLEANRTLVVSFSRPGSRAIGDRVRQLSKQLGLRPIQVRTFHSLCYQMMHLLGKKPVMVKKVRLPKQLQGNNTYFNRRWYNAILVDLFVGELSKLPQTGSDGGGWGQTINDYESILDSIRSGHPSLQAVIVRSDELDRPTLPDELSLRDGGKSLPRESVLKVLQAYERELMSRRLIDYAGMVGICLHALRTDANFRLQMQTRIAHLLVDEFQDTSRAQEEMMRLLVGPLSGLTVVGDNDQTIFTFNGSDVSNILEFSKRNTQARNGLKTTIIPLEENFRCTARILSVAGRIVAINKHRLKKKLIPSSATLPGRREEYRARNAPVLLISTDTTQDALNFATQKIQQWLDADVEPQEIAVLSRMNPGGNSDNALLDQLKSRLRIANIPTADAKDVGNEPQRLLQIVAPLANSNPDHDLQGLSESNDQTISKWFRKFDSEGTLDLIDGAIARGVNTVGEWREELEAAVSNPQDRGHPPPGGVNLKTIHSAKGEEYRRVIVLHLDGNIFPPKQSNQNDEEEERRLLYVALTRAEEEVIITGKAPKPGEKAESFLWDDLVRVGQKDLFIDSFRPENNLTNEGNTELDIPEEICSIADTCDIPDKFDELNELGQSIGETGLTDIFNDMLNDENTDN